MSSPTSGAEFRLDVEKAAEAITELRSVLTQLTDLRAEALNVARTPRTAMDAVSTEASELLSQRAAGGAGSMAAAVNSAMEHVEGLIAQMEADLSAQERLDVNAASDLSRS